MFYSLPILRKLKKRKLPFRITNAIRGFILVLMLLLLFGVVGGKNGFVLYHAVNPFNLFDLEFEEWSILATVVASLGLALFVYRPFCQFVCPFGFLSWLAERASCARVRIDKEKCVDCGICAQACPLEAMKGRLRGSTFAADCYSCGRCLNVCPQDAIRYGSVFANPSAKK